MAPLRKSAKSKTATATSGLFFGGTQHVQQQDDDYEEEEQDQTYLYESDAEEDAEFEEPTSRTATAKKPAQNRRRSGVTKPDDGDLDSEDELIVTLKRRGVKDDAIVNQLVETGHQRYAPKTIATRWQRIKKVADQKEEERMDDELYDWRIGEDEKLREYFNTAQAKYDVEVVKLKERMWKEVSASMADDIGEKKYTAKACKERWESLEDGTALLPLELDKDQDHRTVLREQRFAEAKRRREEAKAEREWAAGEKGRKEAEKRAIKDQKERERLAERLQRQAEREEDERIKAEQRAGRQKQRDEQRAIDEYIKKLNEEKRNERKNADAMYIYYTGKKLNGRKDHKLIKGAEGYDEDANDSDSDVEMHDSLFDNFEDDDAEPEMPDLTDAEESSAGESDKDDENEFTESHSNKTSNKVGTRKSSARAAKVKKPKVTLETLVNPRTIMSDTELAEVLFRRELPRRARGETHPEVVARLAAADAAESEQGLKNLLAPYFERRKGTKEVMARRLQEYDAAASEAGLQGVTALDPDFKAGYEGYQGKFAFALEEE